MNSIPARRRANKYANIGPSSAMWKKSIDANLKSSMVSREHADAAKLDGVPHANEFMR